MRNLVGLVVILLIPSTAIVAWQGYSFLQVGSQAHSEEVIFTISPGTNFNSVTQELESKDLIRNKWAFLVVAKIVGYTTRVQAGEYRLDKNMPPMEILKVIYSGKSVNYPFTVQEGLNMFEIATRLEKNKFTDRKEFIKLARDQKFIKKLLGKPLPSLEGYLFPETYNLTKHITAREIIKIMVKRFLSVYKEVQSLSKVQMTRHEAVILASIIEKETGAEEERPLISSVFHNRLRSNMRLQSDPTILYGIMARTGKMKKNITRKDIRSYSPFNTYRVNGLPEGPIANPGREALLAAIKPATSDYFYFVSRNDGTHKFSKTLKAHNSAVRRFQLNRKERQGKSWRDLHKKKQKN